MNHRYLRILAIIVLIASIFLQPHIPVSAQGLSFDAAVNKDFEPDSIIPGETSRLEISIYNSNDFELTEAAWSDNLIVNQPGLKIAAVPNVSSDCEGIVTAEPLGTTISLSGGTVPAQLLGTPGSCSVFVDVTSTTQGNLVNSIFAGDLTAQGGGGDVTNSSDANATLLVLAVNPPTLTKSFASNTIWQGQSVQMTLQIRNTDPDVTLTQLSVLDTFPTNVVVAATPSSSLTSCGVGSSLTATAGSGSVTLNNASITPGATCIVRVNVKSDVPGLYTNSIPAEAITNKQGVTNATLASAPLSVQSASIAKAFVPTSFQAGETSHLTITLRNPTTTAMTGVHVADVLPILPNSNLQVVDGSATTTCLPNGIATTTSPRTVELTNGTIPAGTIVGSTYTPGSCLLEVDVTTPDIATSATYTNKIDAEALTADGGIKNILEATANVSVQALSVGVSKSFSPSGFQQNGSSLLTITISNPTSTDFTEVTFTDTFPAGLIPTDAATTCGGTAEFDGTARTVTLTNGTVPARVGAVAGTCTVTAHVTAATAGSYNNVIAANTISTLQGITNLSSASRSITVYATDTGITASKSFTANSVGAGSNSQLRIQITAPADEDITGFSVTDTFPSTNLKISTPNGASTSGCGAGVSLTANPGESVVSIANGTITKGTTCNIYVNVYSNVSGTYANSIPTAAFINNEGQKPPSNVTASLVVSHLSISKAFYPSKVAANGKSRLTVTLVNTNTSALTSVGLSDNLNTMGGAFVTVASPSNATSTCGTPSFTYPNSQTISMTGGVIPPQVSGVPGVCTVSFDVLATGSATTRTNRLVRTNVSGIISGLGTTINAVADATAALEIGPLSINVVKGFSPITVFGGSASTLSIQFVNPNNTVLTNVSLTDTMPTGMIIANPADLSTGTCGGTLTGNPGENVFTFTGGTLNANKRCTVTLNVTMNVNGNRTNTIPINGVTTFNGAKNTQIVQASLTNLPGASVSKFFSPNPIVVGDYSLLTITVTNTGNIPLSGMGLTDNLPGTLPDGLYIAGSPAPEATSTCGNEITAVPGTQLIKLENGSIAAGPNTTCTIVVPVTSTKPGDYINTIAKNTLVTTEGATNTEPATDTLKVTSAPELQISKALDAIGPFTLNDTITYEITATNQGDIPLTGVTITDPGTGVTLGACASTVPATLLPGESLTCAATHVVDSTDVDNGTFPNTAYADSNETDQVSDSLDVPIEADAAIGIQKISTSAAPHVLGQTLTYDIEVTNIGQDQLTNVLVTDPGTGVTLGSCSPSNGATLNSGDKMICSATHVIDQTDVDAGVFSNTAYAISSETGQVNDTANVFITQRPKLEVYKTVTNLPPYTVGNYLLFDISAINTGDLTLTGVSITDPGDDAEITGCTPAQPAILLQGEILSCTARHLIVQGDMDSGGYSNTAYADSNETEQVSDTEIVITKIPTISLVKTGTIIQNVVAPDDITNAGDRIDYTFTITNTGQVTLNDVRVIDIVGGVTISGTLILVLAPTAVDSTTYTGSYTLTQDDVDAGTFTNTASVTGTPPIGSNVSDTDNETKTIVPVPEIVLEKTGTVIVDVVAPNDVVNAGDKIVYGFSITNIGNVRLTDVTVSDSGITIAGDPIPSMDPNQNNSTTYSGTYTLTQADIDSGSYSNTATVTGTPPEGDDVTDQSTVIKPLPAVPGIELTKNGTLNLGANGTLEAGDTISYDFLVKNTGNVTLSDITLEDTVGGVTISGGPLDSLLPGDDDDTTFTGTYTITQSDMDASVFDNTATVSGDTPTDDTVTDDSSFSQPLTPDPEISLDKAGTINTGSNGTLEAGDTVDYEFTIRNTGNVTLYNISLSDTNPNIILSGGPTIDELSPNASDNTTFSGTYTLTQEDVDSGSFSNTATTTGTPPIGDDVSDDDTDVRTLTRTPLIHLEKDGTINLGSNGKLNAGDTISYAFTVSNTGNVTLTDISITDSNPDVTVSGGPIDSMAPTESDNTTFTGTYTLTQDDIDAGSFTNTATVTGTTPTNESETDEDNDVRTLDADPVIGVAKRLVGSPEEVTPGIWDVTFDILVRNYGNVTLSHVQVVDDLVAASMFDLPHTYVVQSVESTSFTVNWPGYNGDTNTNLLTGNDVLDVDSQGTIRVVVRVTPSDGGPFLNTAVATGNPPQGQPVDDESQDGVNPDPTPSDGDPTNDNDPTPVDFGPHLFDPPMGIKTLDDSDRPLLHWTMVWINDTNIVAMNAAVSDPIPPGVEFFDNGIPTGILPAGSLPDESTANGVVCEDTSASTSTTYCYYEGPTLTYPRGRIVWAGVLGPDLGVTDPDLAVNPIRITFDVTVGLKVKNVRNVATIDADLNGNGDTTDSGETQVAQAAAVYRRGKEELPNTGFAPGMITGLPVQSTEMSFADLGSTWLEIPSLGLKMTVVGVPLVNGQWDISWLGADAGWLNSTAYPTTDGNSVITGHVYLPNGKPGPFVDLSSMRWGEQIILHAFGQKYIYEVREVKTIWPSEVDAALKHEEKPWVTLMTCKEYDEASKSYNKRVLVRAVQMSVKPE